MWGFPRCWDWLLIVPKVFVIVTHLKIRQRVANYGVAKISRLGVAIQSVDWAGGLD